MITKKEIEAEKKRIRREQLDAERAELKRRRNRLINLIARGCHVQALFEAYTDVSEPSLVDELPKETIKEGADVLSASFKIEELIVAEKGHKSLHDHDEAAIVRIKIEDLNERRRLQNLHNQTI